MDRPAFLLKLGESQIQLAKHDEAEKSLREALRLKPDLPMANYDLGVLFEARGDAARAAEAYEAELQAHPNVYQAHFNLGKILSRIGRANDAVRHFRAAVEANPSFGGGIPVSGQGAARCRRAAESEAAALKGLESDAAAGRRARWATTCSPTSTRARVASARPRAMPRWASGSNAAADEFMSGLNTDAAILWASCVSRWLSTVAGCARSDAPAAPPAAATSVLFVTIDTLRADRLGVYGATNVETPNIDRLAREGAWARHSTVHVPLTRPSHISMFTGRYPAEHGIRDNVAPALAADVPLLAELFQREGFSTAAFVSSVVLTRQSGLARGFDHYSDRFEIGEDDARFLNTIQKRGDIVTAEAIAWLKEHPRFFAWVHLYDPHDPYEPPGRYAVQYAERPYDGEVAWSDELVGRLVTALRDAQRLENTLVVVTSDHGEGLGEHGEDVHGYFVYESTLRVPLVVRGPGVTPGTRIDTLTRSVDLFPTLLELAGIRANVPGRLGPKPGVGASRRANRRRAVVRGVAAAARALRLERPADGPRRALEVHPGAASRSCTTSSAIRPRRATSRTGSRRAPARCAPDSKNGCGSSSARRGPTRRATRCRLTCSRSSARSATSVPADPRTAKASGADPKDKLEEYKTLNTLMRQGLIALREGRPAEALDRLGRPRAPRRRQLRGALLPRTRLDRAQAVA